MLKDALEVFNTAFKVILVVLENDFCQYLIAQQQAILSV